MEDFINVHWSHKVKNKSTKEGQAASRPGKFILGLTGGVGSGKSRILRLLDTEYGFHVIQADQVAKALMEPGMDCYSAVVEYLGPSIINEDGSINRLVMAEQIFSDPAKRRGVDTLTHPLVWEACFFQAIEAQKDCVVIEAAIPSKQFRDNCDEMWYVYTSRENRIARLEAGRGYGEGKTLKIMDSQVPEEVYRSFSDVVIDNNGTVEDTKVQIQAYLERQNKIQIKRIV